METFKYVIQLEVEVKTFDQDDAMELLRDTFGPGEDCGVEIISLAVVKEVK